MHDCKEFDPEKVAYKIAVLKDGRLQVIGPRDEILEPIDQKSIKIEGVLSQVQPLDPVFEYIGSRWVCSGGRCWRIA